MLLLRAWIAMLPPTGMGKGALKDIYDVMIALIKKGPRPTYETREYEDSDTEEEDLGTISCEEDDPRDSIDNGEGEGTFSIW
ncbi:hypothetical protein BASA60_003118 [Batrachochytrium salamandrivorans]|nr:hypothetical protein BASA60_003118 [Batrachochytrium salamandrivorans]